MQLDNDDIGEASQGEARPGSEMLRRERKDVLGYYFYGGGPDRKHEHVFCKICGSSLWVDAKGGEEKAKETMKDGEEDTVAVNVSGFFFSLSFFLFYFCFGFSGKLEQGRKNGGIRVL